LRFVSSVRKKPPDRMADGNRAPNPHLDSFFELAYHAALSVFQDCLQD